MSPARLAALTAFAAHVTVEPDGDDYDIICLDREAVTGWPKAAEDDASCLLRSIGPACDALKADASPANADALAALVKRLTVESDDEGAEILIDGVAYYGGDGPEMAVLRAFGELCKAVNAAEPPSLGRFELGAVAVMDVGADTMSESTDTAFVTIGDDEINIEGPRAPEIAAFIVRAGNAHDALLASLKAMVDLYREGVAGDEEPAIIKDALAAIAAAEAQS